MNFHRQETSRDGKEATDAAPENEHQHRIKRLMFIASLYFRLIGVKNPTVQQREDLNNRFKLAYGKGALMLPAAMSSILWGDVNLSELSAKYRNGELPANRLTDTVLGLTPAWCRYDEGTGIKRDIKAVFDCVR